MDRSRIKIAIVLVVIAAGVVAWLLWRGAHRSTDRQDRPVAEPPAEIVARAERSQTFRLPAATISRADDERAAAGFRGRVASSETGQPIQRASLTFVVAGAAVTATSDEDGRFVVEGEAPGSYELVSATAEGFQPYDAQLAVSSVRVSTRVGARVEDVMVYLTPAAKLTVVVQDPSSAPIAGAEVRLLSSRGVASSEPVLTSASGEAELQAEPEQWIEVRKTGFLRATASAQRTMRQRRIVVSLQPGQDAPLLAITGRAIDAAGAPVDGATVEAYSMTPSLLRTAAIAVTDSDGRFTLPDLRPDRYRVRAATPHDGSGELANVAAGATGVELRLGAPEIGIRGVVRDAASHPIAAFAIVATPKDGLVRGAPVRASVIDPGGQYSLSLPPGAYVVSAAARGHAPSADASVEVTTGVVNLDFSLAAGSRIFGRVVEREGGAAIANAYISLAIPSALEGLALLNAATTGNDGSFSFEGLRPGRTSITIQASGYNGRVLGGLEVPPDGPLGPVVVDLGKAKPGEEVIEFVGIAARLEPTPSALRIGATLPGGGASDAGLLAGDMIVAIDGRAVQELGPGSAAEALRGPENTVVMLMVKRGEGTASTVVVRRKRAEVR